MAYHNKTHNGGIDYGPSDTDKLSDPARKRFDVFIKSLHKYRDALSPSLKLKMSDRDMKELAMSLLDDTVFDIVQELEDIQSLTERQLLNKRMKVVGQHKTIKLEMTKRHRDDVTRSKHKPHTLPLLKAEHDKEKAILEKRLGEEMKATDREVILQLDQIVSDQQSTLYQAAVPFFSVTNDTQEIQVQMHVLRFIQKLSQLKDAEKI